MIGEMLGLASFPFAIDDIEIHLHGRADVLVPVLGDFHKKHALQEITQGTARDQHLRLLPRGCSAAPLATPPATTRETSPFTPIKKSMGKKGQMVEDQKIFGTDKLVSMDCIPPALGEKSQLQTKHEMATNAEALLIPQCLIKECALQNSLFLSE